MKWRKEMATQGLTPETTSISVRKKIKDFEQIEADLESAKEDLKTEKDDKAIRKIQGEIEIYEKALLNLDMALTKAMVRLGKPENKEKYAAMATRLPKKTASKKIVETKPAADGTQTTPTNAAPPVETPATTTATAPAATATPPAKPNKIQTPPSPAAPGSNAKPASTTKIEKKGSDNGLLIFGGVVLTGVLAFFGIKWYMGRK